MAMKRRIAWGTCALDEIELVYEKAEENTAIADQLEQLELQALNEAKANIGMFPSDDHKILLSEQFDALSDNDKEILIMLTGNKGLSGLQTDMETATIKIRLSSLIPMVQACTIFSILNTLEKLDGAINVLIPKWTLELYVPLGGRKGLSQWELLIMQLYPWLSIRELSTNETAVSSS